MICHLYKAVDGYVGMTIHGQLTMHRLDLTVSPTTRLIAPALASFYLLPPVTSIRYQCPDARLQIAAKDLFHCKGHSQRKSRLSRKMAGGIHLLSSAKNTIIWVPMTCSPAVLQTCRPSNRMIQPYLTIVATATMGQLAHLTA